MQPRCVLHSSPGTVRLLPEHLILFQALLPPLKVFTIADAIPPTQQLICKFTQVVEIMRHRASGGRCGGRGGKLGYASRNQAQGGSAMSHQPKAIPGCKLP